MSTPFQAQGTLTLPEAPGLVATTIPFGVIGQFDSRVCADYAFPASSGTQTVDFGTLPDPEGAKCVFVTYEAGSGETDISVTINGANQPLPLSPGGFLLFASPSPTAGITSMALAYTGMGQVRVWLLG